MSLVAPPAGPVAPVGGRGAPVPAGRGAALHQMGRRGGTSSPGAARIRPVISLRRVRRSAVGGRARMSGSDNEIPLPWAE